MHFQINGDDKGTPQFHGDLKRVNIFLGTNGSGKSKLLTAIELAAKLKDEFDLKVVRVAGSRRGELPPSFSTQTTQGKTYDDFDEEIKNGFEFSEITPEQVRQLRQQLGINGETLGQLQQELEMMGQMTHSTTRMEQALSHFSISLASEQVEYRKRHLQWMAEGGQSTPPVAPENRDAEAHLDKLLSLFSEIFPDITIRAKDFQYTEDPVVKNMTALNARNANQGFRLDLGKLKDTQVTGKYSFSLTCSKNGQEFLTTNLSDGEKQILSLLADRYFYKGRKCLFLVDEPELNLDPVLAIKYWNLIEREMSDSVFVYTTHSLDFALRENVDCIWSLGRGGAKNIPLESLGALPEEDQRRFLSGIRGVITTDKGLVVEGKESSFDAKFYTWVLGDQSNEFQISYYEGCNDVRAATRRLDIWQQMVPTVTILGIVDADYRAQEELDQLVGTNCLCLGLHDAESFLCHPKLLVALAKELKRDPFPTHDVLVDEICDFVEETMVEICHHRMAQRCSADVAVSLRKKELEQASTFEELTEKVCKSAIKQAGAGLDFSEERVKAILNEELRACKQAKSEKNVNKMLNLVKGKKLVERFAKHFGLSNSLELMEYVSTNLSPTAFKHTRTLREKIEAHFSSDAPTDSATGKPKGTQLNNRSPCERIAAE